MISKAVRMLRDCDRLYFGSRAGRGSALMCLSHLLDGTMPWAFLDRYNAGEMDGEIAKLRLRG